MKKLKFVCFSLITILLLFFSVFSANVNVKAFDGWGAPTSAKNYVGIDGKGVRMYIQEVFEDDEGFVEYADLVPVKNYVFFDGMLQAGTDYEFNRQFFESEFIEEIFPYYLDTYGDGGTIYDWDRIYVYFNVETQTFWYEYKGDNYAGYMLEQYLTLYEELEYDEVYNEGYDAGWDKGFNSGWWTGNQTGYERGYDEGYDAGLLASDHTAAYQEGFRDGEKSKIAENNEMFYKGIEKWLVPAIITVIALGGFVTIAVRKRSEQ
jgi:hypothetical protein